MECLTLSPQVFRSTTIAPEHLRTWLLSALKAPPAGIASDIYSLGLIFYEAFFGQLPYSNLNIIGALVSRGRKAPLLDGCDISPAWRTVITKCLEPDLTRRYKSVNEVLEALEGTKTLWTRRNLLIAAGISASVSLSVPAYRYLSSSVSWKPLDETLVLTPPAGGGDMDLGWLDVAMRKTLEQSGHLKLWDRSLLPEVLERMGKPRDARPDPSDWRDVSLRGNNRQLAFWTIAPVGEGYSLTMRLERLNASSPRMPESTTQQTFQAESKQGLFDSVRKASKWVRTVMGESAEEYAGSSRLPQDITTGSYEALVAFAKGEENFKRNREASIADYSESLRYDPNFTMALVRQGDALSSISRMAEALRAWQKAALASKRRPLSLREDLEFRGMYAVDIGDFATGEAVYSEYIRRFPTSWYGYFFREYPLVWLNRSAEGLEMMKHALRLKPKDDRKRELYIRLHLGWDQVGRRRFRSG